MRKVELRRPIHHSGSKQLLLTLSKYNVELSSEWVPKGRLALCVSIRWCDACILHKWCVKNCMCSHHRRWLADCIWETFPYIYLFSVYIVWMRKLTNLPNTRLSYLPMWTIDGKSCSSHITLHLHPNDANKVTVCRRIHSEVLIHFVCWIFFYTITSCWSHVLHRVVRLKTDASTTLWITSFISRYAAWCCCSPVARWVKTHPHIQFNGAHFRRSMSKFAFNIPYTQRARA